MSRELSTMSRAHQPAQIADHRVLDRGQLVLGLLEGGAQVLRVERASADAPDHDGANVE
jgi:hypothetical protein